MNIEMNIKKKQRIRWIALKLGNLIGFEHAETEPKKMAHQRLEINGYYALTS